MSADSSRLELRVGALILLGIIVFVAIILVSDRISFAGEYRLTAYLKDAGGLHTGSPVTLSGLPIGKVVEISSDSGESRYPVKVVLEVKDTYRLPRSATLSLATSGIFGDAYLAFSGSGSPANATDLLPTDGSAKVYASRGFFDTASEQAMNLLSGVNDVLSPEARADAKRLLKGAADLAEHSAAMAKDLRAETARIDATLANLEKISGTMAAASDRLVPRVEGTLDRLDRLAERGTALADAGTAAIGRADGILAQGEGQLGDSRADLRSTIADLRSVMADAAALLTLTRQGQGVVGQLLANRELAKDVNDIAVNLVQVSELVLEHPEALVFGQSAQQRDQWLRRRDLLRVRRAFQEGWQRAPEPALPKPGLLESGREHALESKAPR